MKKSVKNLFVTIMAVIGMTACSSTTSSTLPTNTEKSLKFGLITLHDENSTYDKNFIESATKACNEEGVELVIKTGVPEDNTCYTAACDLAEENCNIVFADSFSHESFVLQASQEYPNVQFSHATGTSAHTAHVSNFHNAFASIYEGRYLAGYVAGLKLIDMNSKGQLSENNFDSNGKVRIGYVGAFPYAEVKSGYTSYYLGVEDALKENETTLTGSVMDVTFTSSWYDQTAEGDCANLLINTYHDVILSQHADSMGAPSTCESAGVPNVTYNGSTEASCPNTYLISSKIDWTPYFKHMIECVKENKEIETDYVGTFATNSVALTDLGNCAPEGTQEKVNTVKDELVNGTRNVFDCSKFTVNGEHLTSYLADVDYDENYTGDTEVIENGVFMESKYRSAPYFDLDIDGINLLNSKN